MPKKVVKKVVKPSTKIDMVKSKMNPEKKDKEKKPKKKKIKKINKKVIPNPKKPVKPFMSY